MFRPTMKRSLGQNTFFIYFRYFWKVCNKPQGYFCPSSNINPPYCVWYRAERVSYTVCGIYTLHSIYSVTLKSVPLHVWDPELCPCQTCQTNINSWMVKDIWLGKHEACSLSYLPLTFLPLTLCLLFGLANLPTFFKKFISKINVMRKYFKFDLSFIQPNHQQVHHNTVF
jgi:hypothetical protein